jgi:hypothetical protein
MKKKIGSNHAPGKSIQVIKEIASLHLAAPSDPGKGFKRSIAHDISVIDQNKPHARPIARHSSSNRRHKESISAAEID